MIKGALYRRLKPGHQKHVEKFFGFFGFESAPVYYRAKSPPVKQELVLPNQAAKKASAGVKKQKAAAS